MPDSSTNFCEERTLQRALPTEICAEHFPPQIMAARKRFATPRGCRNFLQKGEELNGDRR